MELVVAFHLPLDLTGLDLLEGHHDGKLVGDCLSFAWPVLHVPIVILSVDVILLLLNGGAGWWGGGG